MRAEIEALAFQRPNGGCQEGGSLRRAAAGTACVSRVVRRRRCKWGGLGWFGLGYACASHAARVGHHRAVGGRKAILSSGPLGRYGKGRFLRRRTPERQYPFDRQEQPNPRTRGVSRMGNLYLMPVFCRLCRICQRFAL